MVTNKRHIKFLGILFLMLLSAVSQAKCWDREEYKQIELFSEMEGRLILSFKDAVSCDALDGVAVNLGVKTYTTDLKGYISLPMEPFMEIGNIELPMQISKPGYAKINTSLIVAAGTVMNKRMLLSPTLEGNGMRFILQWQKEPKDLDLHLKGPGFHVSYRDMKAGGEAKLDQDQQNGFGPETITLRSVKEGADYSLSVVNYSAETAFDGTAKVLVYVGDHLDSIIPVNENSDKTVDVLEISNGKLVKLQKPAANSPELFPGW